MFVWSSFNKFLIRLLHPIVVGNLNDSRNKKAFNHVTSERLTSLIDSYSCRVAFSSGGEIFFTLFVQHVFDFFMAFKLKIRFVK